MDTGWTQELLSWLNAHPGWGVSIVFFVSFLESLVLIGILLPGIVILFGVGTLIGLGLLELVPVWVAASVGAFFGDALSFRLASKLDNPMLPTMLIRDVIGEAMASDESLLSAAEIDVLATYTRDPACDDLSTPFLFYKGFHALQAHRIAHWLWQQGRNTLAQFFQNQISVTLGVDIHPAAQVGSGIMFDHATGIVIGETAVIEDDVSILHSVTLGGTGKSSGDRHPKIRKGVLLSAGCKIIGNIEVGQNAKVGAGSVVLDNVPPNVTVAGVPAKIVGHLHNSVPAHEMDQRFN